MVGSSDDDNRLPGGYVLTYLPPLGTTRRNPNFWSDVDVRRFVIEFHRQMTVDQARERIRDALGPDRTPSRSAVARAWLRLDKAWLQNAARVRPAYIPEDQ